MAHNWDQCRLMNIKRGPEHMPVELLSLRGEHVIVRISVVYRGRNWFILRVGKSQSTFSKRQKKKRGFWWKKHSELAAAATLVCLLELRYPAASLRVFIRQLKPRPCRIKGCGLGPHYPLHPNFGQETNSLIRFQSDSEEQWKARAVPSLPPT